MSSSALEAARIEALPQSFYYIPNFITASEEQDLIDRIRSHPWIDLSRRRLQVYPAQLTQKNVLITNAGIPDWLLRPLMQRFKDYEVFAGSCHGQPNHILVNNYRPGEGIMPHEDGDAYDPITATVSLGGHTVLDLYEKKAEGERDQNEKWRVVQEPRSLLVTRNEAYRVLLHGIGEYEIDKDLGPNTICNWRLLSDPSRFAKGDARRDERISLTCRDVRKVWKLGNRLLSKR